MVAGCPHQNPDKRPRGSNCYAIFPEQCGADKAKAFVGQIATLALRDRIRDFSPQGQVRFIMPTDAVTDDLRYGRLNVHMDNVGKITAVDCY
jgi:Peptidase inhibitor I78 family